LANLGARYEWGAIAAAEQHFALPATQDSFELLVVKLNSHVAMTRHRGQPQFGTMDRYGAPSTYCGELHALLEGRPGPAIADLGEAFSSEGKSRLETLNNASKTPPHLRALHAAVVNARLQARRAIVDIQSHRSQNPTVYLVVASVTLNQQQRDSELVVGVYLADHRSDPMAVRYYGLEDDPSQYETSFVHGGVRISDNGLQQPRDARDHREEILNVWIRRREQEALLQDERLLAIARQAAEGQHQDPVVAYEMLKTLSWLLCDLAPVPASVLLFAKGVAGAHHLYSVHRLARGHVDHRDATAIMDEFHSSIDKLSPEQAQLLIDALLEHHLPDGR
jgi:hypothetical protein